MTTPYTKQTWVDHDPATPLNAARLSHLETQYDAAMADVAAAFVPENPTLSIARDGAGHVSSVTENGVAETYTRDSTGRVATITRQGTTKTISRDSSGRVTGVA